MSISTQTKCICGERSMSATMGFIYYEEDYKVVDNLIRFVNSCSCMSKKIKKRDGKKD